MNILSMRFVFICYLLIVIVLSCIYNNAIESSILHGKRRKHSDDESPIKWMIDAMTSRKDRMHLTSSAMEDKLRRLFDDNRIQSKVNGMLQSGLPMQVGYGFLMGLSSGLCLKKVSTVVAFLVGGVFMIIQTLAYNGYMAVNYDKIKHEVDFALDVNKDGEVNLEDVEQIYDKIQSVLSYNMPTGGGFAAGLIAGLRR